MQIFSSNISGPTICKYDFVLVNHNGYLSLGFFYRETATTIQFLHMDSILYQHERGVLNFRKPYVCFVKKFGGWKNAPVGEFKIVLYSPDLLSEEKRDTYYRAVELINTIKAREI